MSPVAMNATGPCSLRGIFVAETFTVAAVCCRMLQDSE